MVRNGVYKASFASSVGLAGAGVVTVHGNEVSGGDQGYWYKGTFQENDGRLTALLSVERHDRSAQSVFGSIDRFVLQMHGTAKNGGYRFTGSPNVAPGLAMTVDLYPLAVDAA